MKKLYIIPIFVPYTNDDYIFYKKEKNKKSSRKNDNLTKEKAKEIIESHLKDIQKEEAKIEIAFLGGNFATITEEKQEELLQTAYEYVKDGNVESIRIFTTPDCINNEFLKRLKKYKVKTIELEAPSANDYILKVSKRKYTFKDIKKASKKIKWKGFKLGYQMMVGLPESTRIDEINTAKILVKLKPKIMRIYPVLVIRNTFLEEEMNQQNYEPLSVIQAVEVCKEIVRIFADKEVNIIQIGLQDTDEISMLDKKEGEVVAGPYHVAFRQLVESSMWYDAIVNKIKKLNVKVKEVEVTVNPIDAENVIGYQKENALKLKDTYDVDLILKQDENVKQGKSKIDVTKTYTN